MKGRMSAKIKGPAPTKARTPNRSYGEDTTT
jgi:hypothetical protein